MAGPRGTRKLDALLSAEDPAASVAAVGVTELFQLVHEIGFADSIELIALATPEQVQGCLDLECWDRDQMQLEASLPWLAALVECGYTKLAEVWDRLDKELCALILSRTTKIYDLTMDEEPDDSDGLPVVLTPDSFFALKLVSADETTRQLIHRVVEDLYRANPSGVLARHTIMAARSEPPAELEDMSYRWRSGRMADLGYVDFHEALEVFRPLDPESVRIGEATQDSFGSAGDAEHASALPMPIAERVLGSSFLARALDGITDADEAARLEMAIIVLVNKVLSAAGVSPGNQEGLGLAAEHTAATVSLGLESVSRGDLELAVRALQTISLTRLHRVGHTLTLRLARLAKALAPRAATADEPATTVLAALLGARPFFARASDTPPGAGVRPFESLDDLRRVAELLTMLALRIAIAGSLDVDLLAMAEVPEPRPALDDHVRTALLRAMTSSHDSLLGGSGSPPASAPGSLVLDPSPLSLAELQRFRATVLADGRIAADVREATAQALLGCLDRAQVAAARQFLPALLHGWLSDLEALGALPESPDPRFVDHIVLSAERH